MEWLLMNKVVLPAWKFVKLRFHLPTTVHEMASSKAKRKKKLKKAADDPDVAAPRERARERPRKRKPILFGGESSIDRTPIPTTFWHRPPTSDVLAAKDDFESLGLVGTSLGMPTEAMFRGAAQRRAFAIRTDHCALSQHYLRSS